MPDESWKKRLAQLADGWKIVDEHHLEKIFKFKNYMDGIRFTNRLAELAEKQQHHPLMVVDYAAVTVKTWTHTTNSLSEKDFMLAAGADKLSS